jgi:alkanesulfonate monooxygenase SsuD/methylene tetrahydromethanopterin reductase-like flavin-dependent oxidoreductase (luciferase family)
VLAKDDTELEQLIERYQPKDRSREEFFATALVGTPEMVLERMHEFIEIGISRFAIIMHAPTPDRLQLFSNAVMSQF